MHSSNVSCAQRRHYPINMFHHVCENTGTEALSVAIANDSDLNEEHSTVEPNGLAHGSAGVAAARHSGLVTHADLIPTTVNPVCFAAHTPIHSGYANGLEDVVCSFRWAAAPASGYQPVESFNLRLKGRICDQANGLNVNYGKEKLLHCHLYMCAIYVS